MHATPANANHTYVSRIRGTLGIQLFKNSFFMIMNKMLAAGSGFVFWVLAANFYSTGDVGMATALISAAGTVLQFSYLGFDYSIIRFFSKYDRSKMFNTCLILTIATGTGPRRDIHRLRTAVLAGAGFYPDAGLRRHLPAVHRVLCNRADLGCHVHCCT